MRLVQVVFFGIVPLGFCLPACPRDVLCAPKEEAHYFTIFFPGLEFVLLDCGCPLAVCLFTLRFLGSFSSAKGRYEAYFTTLYWVYLATSVTIVAQSSLRGILVHLILACILKLHPFAFHVSTKVILVTRIVGTCVSNQDIIVCERKSPTNCVT
uniref:Secreted protein n=1 Tax=Ixodes scapularis TaxID=6945 RepID=A0A4D5S0Q2_IXOSC